MSSWDHIPKSSSSHDINVNLGAIESVSEAIITPTANSKKLIIVVDTCVTVLLVASVTIVVALALTYTGPFATISSTTTTTTTTTITTATTTAIQIAAAGSECSSYTTISDSTRLTTATGGSTCDINYFSTTTTWTRFSGAGGTQLATSAPGSKYYGIQSHSQHQAPLLVEQYVVLGVRILVTIQTQFK
ncbi:unnamed protein product [Rotaria socialis]|uniref:Uncharacterized protein n=1 Tax=Rotaria socialis TaxID=392032 RepID=A0A821GIP7_9BILA|nr:unnamed protein product [Rotaria socialis]